MKIGLLGNRTSGKSTTADYLEEVYGYQRFAFADDVKKFSAYITHALVDTQLSVDEVYEKVFKDPKSPYKDTPNADFEGMIYPNGVRGVSIGVGTAARHMFGRDVWVNRLSDQIKVIENAVVEDVRFENEVDICYEKGYKIIFCNYPNSDKPDVESEQCQALYEKVKDKVSMVIDRSLSEDPNVIAMSILDTRALLDHFIGCRANQ